MAQGKKTSVGLYLPTELVDRLDVDRGRISRSTYITILLETLVGRKMVVSVAGSRKS
jgi:hypothetical protein